MVTTALLRTSPRSGSAVVPSPRPQLTWTVDAATEDVDIAGRDSVAVAWPFADLGPGERVRLSVRVTSEAGESSEWSEPVEVVAGFLADGAWQARMIGLAEPAQIAQPALLRTEFEVTGEVERATLYATAHGVYQVAVNGHEVDDEVLKPGWTAYQFRLVHE